MQTPLCDLRRPALYRLTCLCVLAGSLLVTGCTTTGMATDKTTAPVVSPVSATSLDPILADDEQTTIETLGLLSAPDLIPVARYGRYTLVELVPEPTQRDLLQQVIDVSIPPSLDATVGDGLRHVLLRTGYRLCGVPDAAALYALPLPAAHLHLGPLPLRDALLTLAGPAWTLSVDDAERQVCFRRASAPRPAKASPNQTSAASAAEPTQTGHQFEETQP